MLRLIPFVCLATLSLASFARGQETLPPPVSPEFRPRKYDSIQAGIDAYQLGEERRQANLRNQIAANDAARAASGLPTTRGETIYYYNGYAPGVVPWDSAYAYGGAYGYGNTFGYARTGLFGRRVVSFSTGPVFTPWPYVPGDIYGYRTYPQVRQPIGQHQVQIDENTWESHPVYDPPVTPHRVMPPVDSPLLDNTPFATPRVEPVPVPVEPAPSPTAREF
jgi:hypothetical protein